jgi:hypothetical protein
MEQKGIEEGETQVGEMRQVGDATNPIAFGFC